MIIILGMWLRLDTLVRSSRFHPDEALFATFARSAAVNGDWLLHGELDKTPLSIYTSAVSMIFVGVTTLPDGVLTLEPHRGEFAARLPGVLSGIVLIVTVYALMRRLYPESTNHNSALWAAFLLAISPFTIRFSATAFTDNLMLLCIIIALWMVAGGRWFWAGLWLVLGIWSKQQAIFYLPLLLGVGWMQQKHKPIARQISDFVLPIMLGIVLLLAWDGARGQSTSFLALAAANNNPERFFISPDEIIPRLISWLRYAQFFTLHGGITVILSGLALIAIIRHRAKIDAALLVYFVLYGLGHWLLPFNTYDRYLLPALPLALILFARGLALIQLNRVIVAALAILMIVVSSPALDSARDELPSHADQKDYEGIDRLADHLNSKTLGAIIYDHWLGWELGYYMGEWSNKRRVYYPTPEALAADALLQPDPAPRYFVALTWADAVPWLEALRRAGFAISADYAQDYFQVYQLIPPGAHE